MAIAHALRIACNKRRRIRRTIDRLDHVATHLLFSSRIHKITGTYDKNTEYALNEIDVAQDALAWDYVRADLRVAALREAR